MNHPFFTFLYYWRKYGFEIAIITMHNRIRDKQEIKVILKRKKPILNSLPLPNKAEIKEGLK